MVRGPVLLCTSCITLDSSHCLSDPQFLFLEKCLTYLLSGIMWGSGETKRVQELLTRPSTLGLQCLVGAAGIVVTRSGGLKD